MPDQIEKIKDIKKKYEKTWLAIEGVVAVGIGKTSDGNLGIIVSVKENGRKYKQQIVHNIEGVLIEIQETGEIKAF
ncbi:hypothetical protein ES705_40733 [subsurface metagenome]